MIYDLEYFKEEISKSYSKYPNDQIKILHENKNILTNLKKLSNNIKWLKKCSMLLEDNRVIHGVKEINCNVTFCKNNICYGHISLYTGNYTKELIGIFIHTDCWKYIKNTYNINLNFSNLPPHIQSYTKVFNIDYGDIEKYWGQDFNFLKIVNDKKEYLCSSPLKEDKNISQIKKNISKLNLKNEPERKGPMVSATFYKEGDIKIGNNNNFWIIKGNKWVEINQKPIKIKIKIDFGKLDKKQRKFLDSVPYIGHYNKNPIFIISINDDMIELILLESYKEKIIL
jgi:hypothetical protein